MVLGDSYVETNSEVSDNHQADFPSNKESAYDFSVTSKHHKYEVFTFLKIQTVDFCVMTP